MFRLLALLVLFPALCWGQLTVSTKSVEFLKNVDAVYVFDNENPLVFIEGAYERVGASLISVETPASTVIVEVEDLQRNPVEPFKVADKVWAVHTPGVYWVDVTAIDFDQRIFERRKVRILVEEVKGCDPVPDPDPDPEPDPDPDPEPEPGNIWEDWLSANPPPLDLKSYFPQLAKNFREVAEKQYTDPLELSNDLLTKNRATLGNNYIKFLDFSFKLQQKLSEEQITTLEQMQKILPLLANGLEKL